MNRLRVGAAASARSPLTGCCLWLTALAMIGCSGAATEWIPVEGTVTIDGKPVTQGTVQFFPTDGGRPASGQIGPDGRYELTTTSPGDGVLPGRYEVTITALTSSDPRQNFKSAAEEREYYSRAEANRPQAAGEVTWIVPEAYSQRSTSPLAAVVSSEGGPQDFNIPAAPPARSGEAPRR